VAVPLKSEEREPLLLRNSRKTECGAKQFLTRLAVRAAPFALLIEIPKLPVVEDHASRNWEATPVLMSSMVFRCVIRGSLSLVSPIPT
jgi:hypothetical protein